MQLHLDHIVFAAPTLDAGVRVVEERLGVTMAGGGAHPGVATHNRLLGFGDCYLEAIARDPSQQPTRRRWFGLDDPQWAINATTHPRIVTWVLRVDDLDAALRLPGATGIARKASRGDLSWRIGVPDDGALPEDGAFPTFIEWPDGFGPARTMPDAGCTLVSLIVRHPSARLIEATLADALDDARIRFESAAESSLSVQIATPAGPRALA